MSTGTLERVALTKIAESDHNPRTVIDEAALAELTESIKASGVLQPVLLKKNGGAKFELVDGKRRVAAARAAKVKDLPALIVDEGLTREMALVANLQREDLTPLEEAEALHALQQETGESARAIAKRVGKSNDYVSDRLRLVKLPDEVKVAVENGTVGLHAVPAVARLAEAAPNTAAAVVRQIAGDDSHYSGRDLEDTEMFVEIVHQALEDPDGELWALNGANIKDLPIEDADELSARHHAAKSTIHGYSYGSSHITFDQDDVDAARAFGCLFSIEDTDWRGGTITHDFVNDAEWLADRVRLKIEHLESEAAKKAKKTDAESGGAKPSKDVAAGDKGAITDAKEERRKQREKEERAKVTARGHNLDLGVKLAKAFKAPKLTADNMRLIAELALYSNFDAAVRGLRYVDERLQTVEAQKNGKTKITYAESSAARQQLRDELDKAKTPEEIAGVVLKAIAAAHWASQDVVAQSNRSYWKVPGVAHYAGANNVVGKLLEKIAGKLVPGPLKKGAGK